MKQRPWMTVAAVLVVLLAGTLASGVWLRGRLDDAAEVLDAAVDPALAERIGSTDDIGVPVCDDPAAVAEEIRAFHAAVDGARAEAESKNESTPDLTSTRASFDSFLLESAIARVASGKHQLLVRARPDGDGWCVDDVVFSTEE